MLSDTSWADFGGEKQAWRLQTRGGVKPAAEPSPRHTLGSLMVMVELLSGLESRPRQNFVVGDFV